MDMDQRCRGVAKGVSMIQHEQLFFNRIISRDSSLGCSSRIYNYGRNSEGKPFNWEMQPGTPKEPRKEDILPPLSPPPALISLGLPKLCINIQDPKPSMKLWTFKFWKQGKRINGNKKLDESDKYFNCEMCNSDDGEFMASPSMSSSSFSSSNGVSFGSSRLPSPYRDSSVHRHYGCSPLNFSSILVRMSRSR
ncbi:hypothetical protein PTKIN_Ptkin03bG0131000 [Pterospermum kingtungense]